jgi:hypothetical protein
MKRSMYFLGICVILSCSKSDSTSISTSTNPPVTIKPTPVTPVVTLKNYLLTSYELQQSDVTIDIMKLRLLKEGINSGWNILAVAFLDINADGNDDIFYTSGYGDTSRTEGKIFIFKNGEYILDNSYFTTPPSLILARKAIVGDYNGDKMPDIFIAATGDDHPPFPGEYNEMLLSNSNKKYDLVKFTDKVGFFHAASSGDIDNDGDLDIFCLETNWFGGLKSHFLINDGKANFTSTTDRIDGSKLFNQAICELIDLDKDGFLDLIMGGHEMEDRNTTRIYWGSSSFKFDDSKRTDLQKISDWGVITDIDAFDLNEDGVNELVITRTGGRPNDYSKYFYSGWKIQILQLKNRGLVDETSNFIDNNTYTQAIPDNQEWIPWMRFGDFDKNGKMDFYSIKCTNLPMVRWELQNKKLVRMQ